jgi:hypothetical protein
VELTVDDPLTLWVHDADLAFDDLVGRAVLDVAQAIPGRDLVLLLMRENARTGTIRVRVEAVATPP